MCMAHYCHGYIRSTKGGEKDNPDQQDTYDTDQTNKTYICMHAACKHKFCVNNVHTYIHIYVHVQCT